MALVHVHAQFTTHFYCPGDRAAGVGQTNKQQTFKKIHILRFLNASGVEALKQHTHNRRGKNLFALKFLFQKVTLLYFACVDSSHCPALTANDGKGKRVHARAASLWHGRMMAHGPWAFDNLEFGHGEKGLKSQNSTNCQETKTKTVSNLKINPKSMEIPIPIPGESHGIPSQINSILDFPSHGLPGLPKFGNQGSTHATGHGPRATASQSDRVPG